jgi:hypothetical protein
LNLNSLIEISPVAPVADLKIRISSSLPGADFLKEMGSSFAPQGTRETLRTLKFFSFCAVKNHHPGVYQIDNKTWKRYLKLIHRFYVFVSNAGAQIAPATASAFRHQAFGQFADILLAGPPHRAVQQLDQGISPAIEV